MAQTWCARGGIHQMTKSIGRPGANAVPFWVRIMLAKADAGPQGEPMMTVGTLGLQIFGLRELDYAPVLFPPLSIMTQAYSVAEYLLRSGKRLDDGETIGVEGQTKFAISFQDAGQFVSSPVAHLTMSRGE